MGKIRELQNKREYYLKRADELNDEIGKLKNPDIDEAHLKMLMRGHRWPTKGMMKLTGHNPILDKVFAILSYGWDCGSVFEGSLKLAERLPQEQRTVPVTAEKATEDGFKYCPWPRKHHPRILVEVAAVHVSPMVWTKPDYQAGTVLAHSYLASICRAGAWEDMKRFAGQRKEGRGKIYSPGYWSIYGGLHRVPFLKDSPAWHERLRVMTLQPEKKANYNGEHGKPIDIID